MLQLSGGSSPVKTEHLQIVLLLLLVVVVGWLYHSKRIIIVRWADLSDFFVHFRL